jgi:hypothetical protein
MAKEVSINAALSARASESVDLANWLTRDLRVVGKTPSVPPVETESPSLPPPPSLDEAAMAPAATSNATALYGPPLVIAPGVLAPPVEAPPPDASPAESAASASPVQEEPVASADTSDALGAEGGLYGVNRDWSSDDDAFFASSPDTADDVSDERLDDEDPVADAAVGTSLSPQVLESEDDDTAAPIPLPGVGVNPYVKVAAGVAAALLLLFFFVHHRSPTATPVTAARSLPPSAVTMPAPPTDPGGKAEPPSADTAEEKGTGHAKGLSDFGGKHAPPADGHEDPTLPGGPSVARFPDLPRDILNALEQAFESGEGKKDANKPRSDATGGY